MAVFLGMTITAFSQSKPTSFTNEILKQDRQILDLKIKSPAYEIVRHRGNIPGQQIICSGIQLPAQSGYPDIPVYSKRILVPKGADVSIRYEIIKQHTVSDIDLAPAPQIPFDTDTVMVYKRNNAVYQTNAFFPEEIARISQNQGMGGYDTRILNWAPFRFNPVTGELQVIDEIRIQINFAGGNGSYRSSKHSSAIWNNILASQVLNPENLVKSNKNANQRAEGYEYLLVIPNDTAFRVWADTLARFRNEQGIKTGIVTLDEIGGNTSSAIEAYLVNAVNNWEIPPAAVLFMADYGTSADNRIISPVYDNYCISDNLMADFDNDGLPEIATARMTARDAGQLAEMVRKAINYERNPVMDDSFYDKPVTALGWQTERWFQICSEAISGYFSNSGKNPVRINDVYEGNPNNDPWSTSSNTWTILNTFGPAGLGYIPSQPSELGGWYGGTADKVNEALNEGTFMLVHRDHGGVDGWGEPNYDQTDIRRGLNGNEKLPFIFSINCLTGKFNVGGDCFAETFHRDPARALGIIAATEVSYSFVNDTYMWGMMDYMFPDFLPETGENGAPNLYPAFANVSGKYFLEASSWPWNENNKEVTYMLFHHHGDAFQQLFSEVPAQITSTAPERITDTATRIQITAPEGCRIGISHNGNYIAHHISTGGDQWVVIPQQEEGTVLTATISGPNYQRKQHSIQVVPNNGPFLVCKDFEWPNGQLEAGKSSLWTLKLENIGFAASSNITLNFSTDMPEVSLSYDPVEIQNLDQDAFIELENILEFTADCEITDGTSVPLTISISSDEHSREQQVQITVHAPSMQFEPFGVSELDGNTNNWLEPGESGMLSLLISNEGSAPLHSVAGTFSFIQNIPSLEITSIIEPSESVQAGTTDTIKVFFDVAPFVAEGTEFGLEVVISGDCAYEMRDTVAVQIGRKNSLIIDLDRNHNSGDSIIQSLTHLGYTAEIVREWPLDLSEYQSVFVCIGMFGSNDVLTLNEGAELAEYVENNGNLYLEGGDFWVFNPKTDVHPLFHIEGLEDGFDDLGEVAATYGAFTEGMDFNYTGDVRCVDRIKPIDGAKAVFYNPEWTYFTTVTYESDKYRTIGSVFEFGGLENAEEPSTRDELMRRYMTFFGILQRPDAPAMPAGDTDICAGQQSEYSIPEVNGATAYEWRIVPEDAATFEMNGNSVQASWNENFSGTASLFVYALKDGVAGAASELLEINVNPLPEAPMQPIGTDSLIWRNDVLQAKYFLPQANDLIWKIEPENAATYEMTGDSLLLTIADSYTGELFLSAAASNECGQSAFGESLKVTILSSLGVFAPEKTDWNIYPNPATKVVYLKSSNATNAVIKIYSMNGSLQAQFEMQAQQEIPLDVSNLNSGLYLLEIITDSGVLNKRLIINR